MGRQILQRDEVVYIPHPATWMVRAGRLHLGWIRLHVRRCAPSHSVARQAQEEVDRNSCRALKKAPGQNTFLPCFLASRGRGVCNNSGAAQVGNVSKFRFEIVFGLGVLSRNILELFLVALLNDDRDIVLLIIVLINCCCLIAFFLEKMSLLHQCLAYRTFFRHGCILNRPENLRKLPVALG